jgi:ABC-type polysaccharide/polyol phosphate export permease
MPEMPLPVTEMARPDTRPIQPLEPPRRRPFRLTVELLLILTWKEIAIKYKQSVMGFLWAILMPCLIVLAGLIVRFGMARMSGIALAPDVVTSLLVKALPWAFFVSAIRLSTNSLASNANLVTRSNCPRIVFPISSVLSSLVDFMIAALPAVIALGLVGVALTPALFWVVPLLLLMLALTCGLGLLLATANLFYRDVKYIVEVFLTFGIFFSPVIYEAHMLGEWAWVIMLNPIAPILEGLHASVVQGATPPLGWLAYSAVCTAAIAGLAAYTFRRLEPVFADRI